MVSMLMLVGVFIGAEPLPEAAQKELKVLQGKWQIVGGERNGKKYEFAADDTVVLVVEIKGDQWLLGQKGEDQQADKARIVMLDPKANPKCMDQKSVEKRTEGVIIESIYKLDGDTLTICSYQGTYLGKPRTRPAEFKSSDNDTIVVVLKRLKK